LEVENSQSTGWEDLGTYQTNTYKHASFSSPLTYQNFTTETNPSFDVSTVSDVVDPFATNVLASGILQNNSDIYSIQAVADAFDWVRGHITYVYDTQDHWQPPSQTLSWRTGDCKDQAILMASLIDQMGGDARVNIINEHAFATVYIGDNGTNLTNVQLAISSHYGTDVPKGSNRILVGGRHDRFPLRRRAPDTIGPSDQRSLAFMVFRLKQMVDRDRYQRVEMILMQLKMAPDSH
jgi:transglutaminase-like putative cysteine protease